jgi:uncharacterized protein (DUF433 family)
MRDDRATSTPWPPAVHEQDIELFTPAEAAGLSGLTLKAVNNAIDKKTVFARIEHRNGRSTRLLDKPAILFLCLQSRLAGTATAEFRRQLFAAITGTPGRRIVSVGALKLDLSEPRRQVTERVREFRRSQRIVVSDPEILGGTPVFRRTRIPVRHIADLLRHGERASALQQAYPRLTDEMIRLAAIYVAANPPRGRPRKRPWSNQDFGREVKTAESDAG